MSTEKTPQSEVILQEIEAFGAEVERRRRGEANEEQFKAFRLQHGIYGQRQPETQMVRVKIPGGVLSMPQFRMQAQIAEKFSNGIVHTTTRQDTQIHWVPLERVPEMMSDLASVGLTTREACGNTVRNVTCEPYAGVHPDDAFNCQPYTQACTDYFIRNPICQSLPRKFKIVFSGREGGSGYPGMHDIALIAHIRDVDGVATRGFRVLAGGGLGAAPRPAYEMEEWVPVNRFLPVCEALVRLFNEHGNRDNRNRARMKFVLEKLGLEEFIKLYKSYLDQVLARGEEDAWDVQAPADAELPKVTGDFPKGNGHAGYPEWIELNTMAQKQPGYYAATVKLVLGDIWSSQVYALADFLDTVPTAEVRVTADQDLIVLSVPQDRLPELYDTLVRLDLATAGAETVADVISCPGAETCNLGITASRGLGQYLTDEFTTANPRYAELKDLRIKISGCPNSCGHHHMADIGFHGGAKRVSKRLVPHYEVFLGADREAEPLVFSEPSGKIPAKNAPGFVRAVTERYLDERNEGERFGAWVRRVGMKEIKAYVKTFTSVPSFEEAPERYIDWNAEKPFELDNRGQGECAGKLIDLIEGRLIDAERALFQAVLMAEKGNAVEAILQADRAMMDSVRAILSTEGLDPTSDAEALQKFESLILDMEIIPPRFGKYLETIGQAADDEANDRIEEIRTFIQVCAAAYRSMNEQGNLRLRTGQILEEHIESITGGAQPSA